MMFGCMVFMVMFVQMSFSLVAMIVQTWCFYCARRFTCIPSRFTDLLIRFTAINHWYRNFSTNPVLVFLVAFVLVALVAVAISIPKTISKTVCNNCYKRCYKRKCEQNSKYPFNSSRSTQIEKLNENNTASQY